MKNFVLKYGLLSVVFLIVPLLIYLTVGSPYDSQSFDLGEVVGYATIVLSMIFVFLGIKKYRDDQMGGEISFVQAMKMGTLIIFFPAIAFTAYNFIYVKYLDPDFIEKYYDHQVEKAKAEADPADYEAIELEMAAQKEAFTSISLQSVVMFATVFFIGIIVNVLSSLILSRRKVIPATGG